MPFASSVSSLRRYRSTVLPKPLSGFSITQVVYLFPFLHEKGHNGGMSDTVQQIKDKLSITDVVSQYVKLERAGLSLRAVPHRKSTL